MIRIRNNTGNRMLPSKTTHTFLLTILWCCLHVATSDDLPCPMPSPCLCQQSLDNSKRVIYCRRKGLSAIPSVTPSNESFYELTLSGNNIRNLPDNAFVGLNVDIIDLQENPIASLSNLTFVGLPNTIQLLIEANNAPFPKEALMPLTGLKKLKMVKFSIPMLPANAFSHMTSLDSLTIDECSMSAIDPNAFSGLEGSLTILDLNANTFRIIPSAVSNLSALKDLVLTRLPITEIPQNSFVALENLEHLDMSHSSLATLHTGAFTNMTNLLYLSLAFNQLQGPEIRKVGGLTNLEQLDLAGNKIDVMPDGVFVNTSKLAFLSLDGNGITHISREKWDGLEKELHTLLLGSNKIATISDNAFAGLEILEELRLEKQDLSGVLQSNTFQGLENSLKRLKLSEAKLESRHLSSISGLTKLVNLELDSNEIATIPESTFARMDSLQILILDSNKIENLTQSGMYGMHNSLQKISLGSNPLAGIGECVFFEFPLLKEIDLSLVTTLHCDCYLQWLRERTDISVGKIPFLHPTCASPAIQAGKKFSTINAEDLVCGNNVTSNVTCQSLKTTLPPPTTQPTTTEMITTTTTTQPTTTTEPPTTTPPFIRGLTIIGIERKTDQITVQWKVTNTENLQGFMVKHRKTTGSNVEIDSQPLTSNQRDYTITKLSPNTEYTICVYVSLGSSLEAFSKVCQFTETRDETTDGNNGGDADPLVGIIVGSVIGGIVLLALIIAGVIGIIYFSRKRKSNDLGHFTGADSAGGVPMKDFPHMGVQSKSKHFVRNSSQEQGAVGGYDNDDVFYEPDAKGKVPVKNNNQPTDNRRSDPRYLKHPQVPPAPKAQDLVDDGGYLNPTGPRPEAPDDHKYYEIRSVHI